MRAHRYTPLLLLLGCAPAAPDEPTWLADVRPILAANCIRCHGSQARNGAPATFRLDVLDDTGDVKGARSMAEFIAARAAQMGDMPPEGPRLSSRQKEILEAWQYTTTPGMREGNAEPAATLAMAEGGGDMVPLEIVISDADGDLVTGELKCDGAGVAVLHGGAQRIELDTTSLASGPRALTAILDDGSGAKSVDLGTLPVSHGNAVPSVEIVTPRLDDLFVAGERTDVIVRVTDADPGDAVTVDLFAVKGGDRVDVARGLRPERSGLIEQPFDTGALDEGNGWRIEAVASDGKAERTATSAPFIVSRPQRVESYEAVKPIIANVCKRCHSPHLPSGPNFDLLPKLQEYRGKSWRRLQARQMPPPSMKVVFPTIVFTEDDRARLIDWFYAGAPQ